MQIGDRVRDKGTNFEGTIVQLDPASPGVAPTRAMIQADETKPHGDRRVGDPPPARMWQRIEQIELISAKGEAAKGTPGSQLDAAGHRLDSAAHAAGGTGPVDAEGKQLPAGAAGIHEANGRRVDNATGTAIDPPGSTTQPQPAVGAQPIT
jgi:hypothetical protein